MELPSDTQKELDRSSEIKNLKKIEAALFISARYLTIGELVGFTDINPLLLRELLDKLKIEYKARESAIELIENNGTWKMDVKEEYHKMINKMATGDAEFTKAEQETLAVIAYKQPVKQSIIIKIRGNKAYDHVKHFSEVGLLKSKRIGHTKELQLSENFYDYFSLEKKVKEGAITMESMDKEGLKKEGAINEKEQDQVDVPLSASSSEVSKEE